MRETDRQREKDRQIERERQRDKGRKRASRSETDKRTKRERATEVCFIAWSTLSARRHCLIHVLNPREGADFGISQSNKSPFNTLP